MTAVTSRLRGDQLTLAYGKKTIAESLSVTIPDEPLHRHYWP